MTGPGARGCGQGLGTGDWGLGRVRPTSGPGGRRPDPGCSTNASAVVRWFAAAVGGLRGVTVAALRRPWLVAVARFARGDKDGEGCGVSPLPGGGSVGGAAGETIRQVGALYTLGQSSDIGSLDLHECPDMSDISVRRVTRCTRSDPSSGNSTHRTPPARPPHAPVTGLRRPAKQPPPRCWPASAAINSNKHVRRRAATNPPRKPPTASAHQQRGRAHHHPRTCPRNRDRSAFPAQPARSADLPRGTTTATTVCRLRLRLGAWRIRPLWRTRPIRVPLPAAARGRRREGRPWRRGRPAARRSPRR